MMPMSILDRREKGALGDLRARSASGTLTTRRGPSSSMGNCRLMVSRSLKEDYAGKPVVHPPPTIAARLLSKTRLSLLFESMCSPASPASWPERSSCGSGSLLLRKNPSSAEGIAWTCTCARMAPAISFRNHLRVKGVVNRGHLELATE